MFAVTMAPFAVLAVLESLTLQIRGHLVAEWLIPLVAALVVTAWSKSADVITFARMALFYVAVASLFHGHSLLSSGYTMHPFAGKRVETGWFTVLLGYRRIVT